MHERGENVKPFTRLEHFLAKIAGDKDAKDIKPITRKEYYLNEIAESGGGVSISDITVEFSYDSATGGYKTDKSVIDISRIISDYGIAIAGGIGMTMISVDSVAGFSTVPYYTTESGAAGLKVQELSLAENYGGDPGDPWIIRAFNISGISST